jgi:hypothetical protein
MRHKPTSEEARIIRDCAQRSAGKGRVKINASTRISTVRDSEPNMNVAFVTDGDLDTLEDTDLFSNCLAWSDFTRGVELTDDGRGCFDFWVYSTGYWGELETNVTAYYRDARLVRVDGTGDGVLWKAE